MPEKDWKDIVTYLKRAVIGAVVVLIINIIITWNVHSYRINQIEQQLCANTADRVQMKEEYRETRERLIDFMPTINMRLHYIEKDVKEIKEKLK